MKMIHSLLIWYFNETLDVNINRYTHCNIAEILPMMALNTHQLISQYIYNVSTKKKAHSA